MIEFRANASHVEESAPIQAVTELDESILALVGGGTGETIVG